MQSTVILYSLCLHDMLFSHRGYQYHQVEISVTFIIYEL